MQTNLFNNKDNGIQIFDVDNGALILFSTFYNIHAANNYFAVLRKEVKWQQDSIIMYGKTLLYPRLTAWYGDNGRDYQFSNTRYTPHPWLDALIAIRSNIAQVESATFNSVLLNLYRNGNDSVSWHTDAEPELGVNPTIASVNFGAARRFMLRRIDNHKQKLDILLPHGSLLIMKGELQHFWQHQVPKTSQVIKERINLTYRYIYH